MSSKKLDVWQSVLRLSHYEIMICLTYRWFPKKSRNYFYCGGVGWRLKRRNKGKQVFNRLRRCKPPIRRKEWVFLVDSAKLNRVYRNSQKKQMSNANAKINDRGGGGKQEILEDFKKKLVGLHRSFQPHILH